MMTSQSNNQSSLAVVNHSVPFRKILERFGFGYIEHKQGTDGTAIVAAGDCTIPLLDKQVERNKSNQNNTDESQKDDRERKGDGNIPFS